MNKLRHKTQQNSGSVKRNHFTSGF